MWRKWISVITPWLLSHRKEKDRYRRQSYPRIKQKTSDALDLRRGKPPPSFDASRFLSKPWSAGASGDTGSKRRWRGGLDERQESGSHLRQQYETGFFFLPLLFSPKSVFICWPAEKQLLNHRGKTNDTVVGTRLCFMCRRGGEGGGRWLISVLCSQKQKQ